MKQFFRSLLLSLLLTGLIGVVFRLFQQGTFFDPMVNWITTVCLMLLLAIVWYLFFSNLWFHHMQRKQRVLNALPQPQPARQEPETSGPQAEPEANAEAEPEPEAESAPEPAPEPEPANGPEATVFIPPQPQEQTPSEGWTTAPESAQRPAKPASSRKKASEEDAQEKARKLHQAAQEKQARRARKLAEDAANQQKKLEELRAAAARKKAAAPKKRVDWKTTEQENNP